MLWQQLLLLALSAGIGGMIGLLRYLWAGPGVAGKRPSSVTVDWVNDRAWMARRYQA